MFHKSYSLKEPKNSFYETNEISNILSVFMLHVPWMNQEIVHQ